MIVSYAECEKSYIFFELILVNDGFVISMCRNIFIDLSRDSRKLL